MYLIRTSNNKEIYTEYISWIRVHPSGNAYLLCDKSKAEGVVSKGTPYLFKDGNSVTEIDSFNVMINEDDKNREVVEQELTDQYLDGIQVQQDLTELQLQLLEGTK